MLSHCTPDKYLRIKNCELKNWKSNKETVCSGAAGFQRKLISVIKKSVNLVYLIFVYTYEIIEESSIGTNRNLTLFNSLSVSTKNESAVDHLFSTYLVTFLFCSFAINLCYQTAGSYH